jgi:hypothetical protein
MRLNCAIAADDKECGGRHLRKNYSDLNSIDWTPAARGEFPARKQDFPRVEPGNFECSRPTDCRETIPWVLPSPEVISAYIQMTLENPIQGRLGRASRGYPVYGSALLSVASLPNVCDNQRKCPTSVLINSLKIKGT